MNEPELKPDQHTSLYSSALPFIPENLLAEGKQGNNRLFPGKRVHQENNLLADVTKSILQRLYI